MKTRAGGAGLIWPLRAMPDVRVAGRFPLDDFGFAYRYLSPATHALHIYEYGGAVQIGRRLFPIRAGDVTLTPAGVSSRYDVPEPGRHWCVHFAVVKKRGESLRLPLHASPGPGREFAVERLTRVARLHAQSQAPGRAGRVAAAAASAALQELLLWLGMTAGGGARAASPTRAAAALDRLAALLEARFTEPLTVPELAAEVGLQQNYLARHFRARYGMTIPRYLLARRIEHARLLLLTTDMPVGRIAARVGMPDAQHFNKQFRKLAGMSPTGVRGERAEDRE